MELREKIQTPRVVNVPSIWDISKQQPVLPLFLNGGEWIPRFEQMARLVSRAVEGIAKDYFCEGKYREVIAHPDHLARIARWDKVTSFSHPIMRLDLFLDPSSGKLTVLEVNSADPSCLAWTDDQNHSVCQTDFLTQLWDSYRFTPIYFIPKHAALVRRLYREHCTRHELAYQEQPRVIFTIEPNCYVACDMAGLARRYWEHGMNPLLLSPQELDNYFARTGNTGDILVTDALTDLYGCPQAGQPRMSDALLQHLERPQTLIINTPTSFLADQKTVLTLLCQEDLMRPYLGDDAEMLASSFPQTFLPGQFGRSHWEEKLVMQKDRFVLKPVNGYGGTGVCIGKEASQEEWNAAARLCANSPGQWIAQEYVETNRVHIVGATDPLERAEECFAVYSIWILAGEFAGIFARYSRSRVINVLNRGGMAPVWFADPI